LRPGGNFYAFEIQDGWLQRVSHTKSTFVSVDPASIATRLNAVGLSQVRVRHGRSGFCVQAMRVPEM
jgi:hypothetical protein